MDVGLVHDSVEHLISYLHIASSCVTEVSSYVQNGKTQ
jgi:hypothetical protein